MPLGKYSPIHPFILSVLAFPNLQNIRMPLSKSVMYLRRHLTLVLVNTSRRIKTHLQDHTPDILPSHFITEIHSQRVDPLKPEETRHRHHPDFAQSHARRPKQINQLGLYRRSAAPTSNSRVRARARLVSKVRFRPQPTYPSQYSRIPKHGSSPSTIQVSIFKCRQREQERKCGIRKRMFRGYRKETGVRYLVRENVACCWAERTRRAAPVMQEVEVGRRPKTECSRTNIENGHSGLSN